ncbi:hypothetical protein GPECTOR_23g108 [Gonium pectorale]|uniref:Threonyl/alanyl tRNA synthetase SAD domain-containing protein n=1 Tax=Gonium pectorale TaxID=33097 RepID=A0A150GGW2_GONPE|nr:hypothetical protein GPECTOR_23g108 [Gonium pectorale]|eukprot:KXZ49019.1 hypothetical protein GPECTOR_23g108 [Gonium pectorale]
MPAPITFGKKGSSRGGKGPGTDGKGGAANKGADSGPAREAAATVGAAESLCPRYEVVLKESPLFPESGGQPCDTGQLLTRREDGSIDAIAVLEVSWKEVRAAQAARGVGRKRGGPEPQVAGQHVLSAVASRLLGADTASWELHPLQEEAHGSGDLCCVAIDLTAPSISAEQLTALEAAANAELRAVRPVAPLLLDPSDQRDVARLSALREQPDFRGKLPPAEKVKGSKLRLVHIEGLDVNACGGTHVRSTGEVQLLKLVGVERTRGQTRLRFVAGGRALAALGGCLGREAALTATLTVPPVRMERREGAKVRKLQAAELSERIGRDLAAAAAAASADGGASPAALSAPVAAAGILVGRSWAMLHRPSSDLDFISAVATAALDAGPPELALLLLTADGTEPGAAQPPPGSKAGLEDSTELTFLVAGRAPDRVKAAGAAVAEALGGRGGGRPGRFQGKASGLHKLSAAASAFVSAVSVAGVSSQGSMQ